MSTNQDTESVPCEALLCQNDATHVARLDLGPEMDVCDDHADEFPEEMLEVKE